MSEDNSARDKQEQSSEQVDGDQSTHLDSLIAQFEGDCDIDVAIDTDRAESSVEAGLIEAEKPELDESPAQTTAAIEAAAEPESIDRNNSSIIVLLVSVVAIAVLGSAIWKDFAGDDKHAVIEEAVKNTAPVQAEMQPVIPVTRDQQVASAAITVSENREVPAGRPEQHEPPASKQELADLPTQVTPPATRQHVDPVARKVVTPKPGITWTVNLTSVSTLTSAKEIEKGLESRGITSEMIQVTIGEKLFYRIRIPGFSSKQEAEQARLPFLKEKGFSSAWLERYRAALRSPE